MPFLVEENDDNEANDEDNKKDNKDLETLKFKIWKNKMKNK